MELLIDQHRADLASEEVQIPPIAQPLMQDMKVKKTIHILKTMDKSRALNRQIMNRQKRESTKTTLAELKICNMMKIQTHTLVIMEESLLMSV